MYWFPRAAVTKYHNRNLLSYSSVDWKVSATFSEGCDGELFHDSHLASDDLLVIFGIPWLVEHYPELCVHLHLAISLCEKLYSDFPFYKTTNYGGIGTHPTPI